jgi:high-affinity K+ transport system ATPase subunit B
MTGGTNDAPALSADVGVAMNINRAAKGGNMVDWIPIRRF